MFQDWENIPDGLMGECWISETVFELIHQASEISDFDAFLSFLDFTGYSLEKEEVAYLLSKFEDCFHGKWRNEEDFAIHIVDECYELPEIARTYFDYGKFSDDLFTTAYYYDDETSAVFNRNY